MPFSSALSEIYLEDFDDAIRREFAPIFYVRYVDDILIIKSYPKYMTIDDNSEKNLLYSLLNQIGLSANKSKTEIYKYTQKTIKTLTLIILDIILKYLIKSYKLTFLKKKYDKKSIK